MSDPYSINRTLLQLLAGSAGRISLPWSVQLANWDSFGKMVIHRKIDIFNGCSRQCSLLSHVLTMICDTYRVSLEFARWCACYFGPIFSIYILWLGRAMIPRFCSSNLSHRCPVSWPFPQRHPLVELQELNPVTSTETNRRTYALVLKITPSLYIIIIIVIIHLDRSSTTSWIHRDTSIIIIIIIIIIIHHWTKAVWWPPSAVDPCHLDKAVPVVPRALQWMPVPAIRGWYR